MNGSEDPDNFNASTTPQISEIKKSSRVEIGTNCVLRSNSKTRTSITDIFSGSCPLLHLLPWLDTSGAAVIGPRSYGLCWWSQRVRKA